MLEMGNPAQATAQPTPSPQEAQIAQLTQLVQEVAQQNLQTQRLLQQQAQQRVQQQIPQQPAATVTQNHPFLENHIEDPVMRQSFVDYMNANNNANNARLARMEQLLHQNNQLQMKETARTRDYTIIDQSTKGMPQPVTDLAKNLYHNGHKPTDAVAEAKRLTYALVSSFGPRKKAAKQAENVGKASPFSNVVMPKKQANVENVHQLGELIKAAVNSRRS